MHNIKIFTILICLSLNARADQVECDVYSSNKNLKQYIQVRVYLNEFYTFGNFVDYPNADEEPSTYHPISKILFMDKECHDQFYIPQCDSNQCNFGLVRK